MELIGIQTDRQLQQARREPVVVRVRLGIGDLRRSDDQRLARRRRTLAAALNATVGAARAFA